MIDQQSLSQAISKVKKYTKDLKQQASINNPHQCSQNYIPNDAPLYGHPHSQTHSLAFQKTKSKLESGAYKGDSPAQSRGSNYSRQKSALNMSMKAPVNKNIQSQHQRQSAFNKSQGRIQIKHLSNLLAGTFSSKEQLKKNGHAHTYTYLNDLQSDKYSEIESNYSIKDQHIKRVRHSKSPSKERHIQHNNTSYAEQSHKVSHLNKIQMRDLSQKRKGVNLSSQYLLQQIFQLQQTIKQYKVVIMDLRHKYMDMEDRLKEKALNDHYIDVLKMAVQELQDKNHGLHVVIDKQNKTISQGEQKFIQQLTSINQYYSKSQHQCTQLKKENQILKQILLIPFQPLGTQSKEERQGKGEVMTNPFMRQVCRSMDQFTQRWT